MSRYKTGPATWVDDPDPYLLLTPRQRDIVHAVFAFDGNRSRAARHLGVTVTAVQDVVRVAVRHGVRVPVAVLGRRGRPDLAQRERTA